MIRFTVPVASLLLSSLAIVAAQGPAEPTLAVVLDRVGSYVAAYGERTSMVVAVEKYTQSVTLEGISTACAMQRPARMGEPVPPTCR